MSCITRAIVRDIYKTVRDFEIDLIHYPAGVGDSALITFIGNERNVQVVIGATDPEQELSSDLSSDLSWEIMTAVKTMLGHLSDDYADIFFEEALRVESTLEMKKVDLTNFSIYVRQEYLWMFGREDLIDNQRDE